MDKGIDAKENNQSVKKESRREVQDNEESTLNLNEEEDPNLQELIENNEDIPEYALSTLVYVRNYQSAPDGYVGGRTFQNREKRLPKLNKGKYQEWDVHPKQNNKNRGGERLVSSKNTSYFTDDHYDTFTQIKK